MQGQRPGSTLRAPSFRMLVRWATEPAHCPSFQTSMRPRTAPPVTTERHLHDDRYAATVNSLVADQLLSEINHGDEAA